MLTDMRETYVKTSTCPRRSHSCCFRQILIQAVRLEYQARIRRV